MTTWQPCEYFVIIFVLVVIIKNGKFGMEMELKYGCMLYVAVCNVKSSNRVTNTGWRTKCHTIDCARNTFLLLQKHLTSGTESILIGWKIVLNEEHVQCDHRFASQPLANEPLHSSQLFDTSLQKARGTTSLCRP